MNEQEAIAPLKTSKQAFIDRNRKEAVLEFRSVCYRLKVLYQAEALVITMDSVEAIAHIFTLLGEDNVEG